MVQISFFLSFSMGQPITAVPQSKTLDCGALLPLIQATITLADKETGATVILLALRMTQALIHLTHQPLQLLLLLPLQSLPLNLPPQRPRLVAKLMGVPTVVQTA